MISHRAFCFLFFLATGGLLSAKIPGENIVRCFFFSSLNKTHSFLQQSSLSTPKEVPQDPVALQDLVERQEQRALRANKGFQAKRAPMALLVNRVAQALMEPLVRLVPLVKQAHLVKWDPQALLAMVAAAISFPALVLFALQTPQVGLQERLKFLLEAVQGHLFTSHLAQLVRFLQVTALRLLTRTMRLLLPVSGRI
jgi:hypothetical protein